ncbi:MAG TPA: hypothetical protein VK060_03390, partial [Ruania sp.]|nr:hypothetical protein [Ruania sp.]
QSTSIVTDVVAGVTDELFEGEEPVAETTEVAAEVVEPVAETTEVATEADEPVVSDEPAPRDETAAEESTPERDGPLLDRITGLIDPVTEPIMDVTQPVTGALIVPTLEQVSDDVVAPIVDEVAAPVLAPVVDDVLDPVLTPVVHDVVAPVVHDVVMPITEPIAADVVGSLADPVIEQTLDPLIGESQVVETPTQIIHLPSAPIDTAVAQSMAEVMAVPMDVESGPSPTTAPTYTAQPVGEPLSISSVAAADSSTSVAPVGVHSSDATDGDTMPKPVAVPSSAPSGTASASGQTGTAYADAVRELELPANSMTTHLTGESLPTVLEVVLKVAIAPD